MQMCHTFKVRHIFKLIYSYSLTNFAVSPPAFTKYIPLGKADMLIRSGTACCASTYITFSPSVLKIWISEPSEGSKPSEGFKSKSIYHHFNSTSSSAMLNYNHIYTGFNASAIPNQISIIRR
jgi:hypothetical protein